MQPERIREPNPDAEDEAHDEAVQRKLDDERELELKRRASGYSPEQLLAEKPRQLPPKKVPCGKCDRPHAAVICPYCREPRPAYLVVKKLSQGEAA